MKQSKLDRMINDQTIIAQKIFNCVPMTEVWSKKQIHVEAKRQGIQQGCKVIDGCLHSLRNSGLIKEPTPGYFTQVKATPEKPKLQSVTAKPKVETMSNKKDDPFLPVRMKITLLEAKMKDFNKDITDTLKLLTVDIDEAELKCLEQSENIDGELEKLRAFRDAMKNAFGD